MPLEVIVRDKSQSAWMVLYLALALAWLDFTLTVLKLYEPHYNTGSAVRNITFFYTIIEHYLT